MLTQDARELRCLAQVYLLTISRAAAVSQQLTQSPWLITCCVGQTKAEGLWMGDPHARGGGEKE